MSYERKTRIIHVANRKTGASPHDPLTSMRKLFSLMNHVVPYRMLSAVVHVVGLHDVHCELKFPGKAQSSQPIDSFEARN